MNVRLVYQMYEPPVAALGPKLLLSNIDCPSSFESEKTLGTLVIL